MVLPWSFWVYLISFQNSDPKGSILLVLHIFLGLSVACVLGYFINDYYDKEADDLVGKPNFFIKKPASFAILLPAMFLLECVVWYLLPFNTATILFLGLQVLLLLMYSIPPVRLKTRITGILVDAIYTRVLSIYIILSLAVFWGWELLDVLLVSSIWMFMVGLRNILVHQIEDYENDSRSGLHTFVQRYGKESVSKGLLRFILPIEIVSGVLAVVLLSRYVQYIYLVYPVFLIFLIVRYNLWRAASWRKMKWKSLSLFILNDLYDDFLPLLILVLFGIHDPWVLLAIPLHLMLFTKVTRKLWMDGRIMITNTWAFMKFVLLQSWLVLSYVVNWFLFRIS